MISHLPHTVLSLPCRHLPSTSLPVYSQEHCQAGGLVGKVSEGGLEGTCHRHSSRPAKELISRKQPSDSLTHSHRVMNQPTEQRGLSIRDTWRGHHQQYTTTWQIDGSILIPDHSISNLSRDWFRAEHTKIEEVIHEAGDKPLDLFLMTMTFEVDHSPCV